MSLRLQATSQLFRRSLGKTLVQNSSHKAGTRRSMDSHLHSSAAPPPAGIDKTTAPLLIAGRLSALRLDWSAAAAGLFTVVIVGRFMATTRFDKFSGSHNHLPTGIPQFCPNRLVFFFLFFSCVFSLHVRKRSKRKSPSSRKNPPSPYLGKHIKT